MGERLTTLILKMDIIFSDSKRFSYQTIRAVLKDDLVIVKRIFPLRLFHYEVVKTWEGCLMYYLVI